MSISQQRVGAFLRESLVYLSQRESCLRQELLDHLEESLAPTAEEGSEDKNGRKDWVVRYLWASVGMVKAGWITKDGSGVWAATPAGREALDLYPEAESFLRASNAAYRA